MFHISHRKLSARPISKALGCPPPPLPGGCQVGLGCGPSGCARRERSLLPPLGTGSGFGVGRALCSTPPRMGGLSQKQKYYLLTQNFTCNAMLSHAPPTVASGGPWPQILLRLVPLERRHPLLGERVRVKLCHSPGRAPMVSHPPISSPGGGSDPPPQSRRGGGADTPHLNNGAARSG